MSAPIVFWGSDGFGLQKLNPFKILENDARKIIIAWLYKRPMTVTQLADSLGFSQPTIFEHIQLLNEAGLVKEVDVPSEDKPYEREKYYVPAFPIISDRDKQIIKPVCDKIGGELFQVFERHKEDLLKALETTPLGQRGFGLRELWGWLRMLFSQSIYKEEPPRWSSGANFYFYGEIRAEEKLAHNFESMKTTLKEANDRLKKGLKELQRLDNEVQLLWNEAFGEGYVHPLPPKGKIGWGTGLHKTPEGIPIGFDWDKLQIVTGIGTVRLPSRKRTYTEDERRLMEIALRELKQMRVGGRSRMLTKKIRRALKNKG